MSFFDRLFGTESSDEYEYHRFLRCPRCGSSYILSEKMGFSFRDAFIGEIFFSNNGWLLGFRNKGKTEHECRACGYTWRTDD